MGKKMSYKNQIDMAHSIASKLKTVGIDVDGVVDFVEDMVDIGASLTSNTSVTKNSQQDVEAIKARAKEKLQKKKQKQAQGKKKQKEMEQPEELPTPKQTQEERIQLHEHNDDVKREKLREHILYAEILGEPVSKKRHRRGRYRRA